MIWAAWDIPYIRIAQTFDRENFDKCMEHAKKFDEQNIDESQAFTHAQTM